MAAIVNDRDVLLQAASVRKLTTAGVAVVPTPSSYNFYLRADGSHGPDYVRISVATIMCDGPFTFAVQGATKLSNITATTADIAFADLTSALVIVTVTAANAGTPVQGSCIIGLVSDGQSGQPGQPGTRGAGVYYATGGGWSDTVAKAACPGGVAIAGDVVTISNGATYALTKKYDGSTWAALGGVYDGSLFVTGSIQAAAINANGLILRDLQGRPILGAGTALSADYFGATVGGDNLCPNSSFEVATNGVLADGWVIYNNNPSGEPATSSIETGRLGGKSLAISWSPSHISEKGIQRSGAVPQWVPNATYIISFYAKTSNLTSTSNMSPRWNVQPTSTVALMNPNLSTAWQRYAFKITWGATVESIGAMYITIASGGGNGNVHFDDVMVVEGDVLPAYYPSTAEALTAANAATAAITAISSDNILSKGEKPAAQQAWGVIYNERGLLQTQAGNLGIDSSAYRAKYDALESYLVSLGTGFNDNTVDTPIVGTTFNTRFSDYYLAKATLQNAMDAAAATKSTWAGTTGPGKPEDGANFIPLGRGTALNEDPTLEKPNSWSLTGNATYKTDTAGAGTTSNKYFLSLASTLDSLAFSKSAVAIDPNKTYSLTANLYQDGSNDRAMWIFVDFYDAAGNWFNGGPVANGGTGWGGGHSGYTYGGVPPGPAWTRCGGQFGAGTSRPIPANARTAVVGVWFNYSGGGSANGGQVQAAQDIRLEQVISMSLIDPTFQANLQDKISKTAASALQAPITLATSGSILAGTPSNGTFHNASGLFGVQNGVVTFSVPISGDPSFTGNITAKSGTLGSLTLAPGGFIAQGYRGTWDSADKVPGPGFLIHANGMLFGDYNNPNYGYIQIGANGTLGMPGFDYSNRQLTLTSPILVNPKTTTSFTASIAPVRITNQTPNVRVSTGIGVSLSGGSGASGYSYQWVFNSDTGGGSNAINATGLLSNASLSITAQCSAGWYYASASVTVTDIATGATARASVRISIQFGSGAEA